MYEPQGTVFTAFRWDGLNRSEVKTEGVEKEGKCMWRLEVVVRRRGEMKQRFEEERVGWDKKWRGERRQEGIE